MEDFTYEELKEIKFALDKTIAHVMGTDDVNLNRFDRLCELSDRIKSMMQRIREE